MRITIAAVGRLKTGAERDLYERYADRTGALARTTAFGPCRLAELPESRASTASARKADEGQRLLGKLPAAFVVIALDETGKAFTSDAFAAWMRTRRDSGTADIAFLIGGPDGHDPRILSRADLTLSFGPMTLPHGLARIILAEQLYRTATILAGHPYHRA